MMGEQSIEILEVEELPKKKKHSPTRQSPQKEFEDPPVLSDHERIG
jgi:hypothetical protein